jgi:LacI family transcriptional regulator
VTALKSGISIRDVAKEAGVGVGTVSRVLNDGSVNELTRSKVIQAMKKLNYEPNFHARMLSIKKTNRVLIIVPEFKTEFHWRILKSFDNILDESNYESVLYPLISEKRLAKLKEDKSLINESDAVIMCTLSLSKTFGLTPRLKKPLILMENRHKNFDSVYVDNFYGGQLAAKMLLERNCRDFFAIQTKETLNLMVSGVMDERLEGFFNLLQEEKVFVNEENIVFSDLMVGPSTQKIAQILKKFRKPGIFALTDTFALIVLQVAASLGKIAGKDFFLVGFDNQSWTNQYGLSTIGQPIEEMGARTAELALAKISNPAMSVQHIKLMPVAIKRSSA